LTISASETDNVINDWSDNKSAITVYIRNINTTSKSTAVEYLLRLNNFEKYVAKEYDGHLTINDLIAKINSKLVQ
jgi:hypothetical protein